MPTSETIAILRAEFEKLRIEIEEKIAALETRIGIMREPTSTEIVTAKAACEKARDAFPPIY